jgi:hypothetical protein
MYLISDYTVSNSEDCKYEFIPCVCDNSWRLLLHRFILSHSYHLTSFMSQNLPTTTKVHEVKAGLYSHILTHRLNVPNVKYSSAEFPSLNVQYGHYLDKHLLEDWLHINRTNQLDASNGSVKISLCSKSVFSGLLMYYYYFFYRCHQVVCWTFKK